MGGKHKVVNKGRKEFCWGIMSSASDLLFEEIREEIALATLLWTSTGSDGPMRHMASE